MMTGEQRNTLDLLTKRGYRHRFVKWTRGGVMLIRVQLRLHTGTMPLRVYPNGTYLPPWYDPNTNRNRKGELWQTLQ